MDTGLSPVSYCSGRFIIFSSFLTDFISYIFPVNSDSIQVTVNYGENGGTVQDKAGHG